MLVVGFDSSQSLAIKIARILKAKYTKVETRYFPDKETYLRYNTSLKGQTLMLVNSLYFPDQKILQVAFAAKTAKELGAKKVILFSPYMPYIRQDKRFKKGECLSSKIFPKLLVGVDYFITIDPHLHRYKSLSQIFKIKTKVLSSNKLIYNYIKRNFKNPIIIGPDKESYRWAKKIAKKLNVKSIILKKVRVTSHKVIIKKFNVNSIKDKQVILLDDIISTGTTMLKTIKMLKNSNIKNINVICVHGLFLEHSAKKLKKAGAKSIVSTNTIPSKYSKIDISNLIKEVKNAF